MSWSNPQHVELLRKLWPEGLSASQIAAQINRSFRDACYTRNAVIGKVGRLGLTGRAAPTSPSDSKKTSPQMLAGLEKRVEARRTLAPAAAVCVPLPRSRTELTPTTDMLGLGAHMCKWPIGDPAMEGFGFCGRLAVGSYCETHSRRAWASPTLRKYVDAKLLAPIPLRRPA